MENRGIPNHLDDISSISPNDDNTHIQGKNADKNTSSSNTVDNRGLSNPYRIAPF
jgi:hypothetical protein